MPRSETVVDDVARFLRERMELARGEGVTDEQLVLDPGPDFAKTPEETVEMLRRLHELSDFEYPMLLALSRKDFGALLQSEPKVTVGLLKHAAALLRRLERPATG